MLEITTILYIDVAVRNTVIPVVDVESVEETVVEAASVVDDDVGSAVVVVGNKVLVVVVGSSVVVFEVGRSVVVVVTASIVDVDVVSAVVVVEGKLLRPSVAVVVLGITVSIHTFEHNHILITQVCNLINLKPGPVLNT